MKQVISILVTVCIGLPLFSQSDLETSCLKNTINVSRGVTFPTVDDTPNIKGDSIHFERSLIIIRNLKPGYVNLFKKGILYPDLIVAASRRGDGKVKPSSVAFIGKLILSDFKEIDIGEVTGTKRHLSFLVWQDNMLNPFQYVLQLTNDGADSTTNMSDFIISAHLTAFGFCSVLL